MANSVEDVKVGLEALFHPNINDFDPFMAPCPFREDVYQNALDRGVVVGICKSLSTMPASLPVLRSIEIAEKALIDLGYKCVEIDFSPAELKEYRDVFLGLIVNNFMKPMMESLEANYEEPQECYKVSWAFL